MIAINKKALAIGQVFVFIIAAITFALIMIFGYKAISGFLESGDKVAFTQFKTDLESDIQRLYTEFDSVRNNEYRTPSSYSRICFVDLEYNPNPTVPQQLQDEITEFCTIDPIACSVWQEVSTLPVEQRYARADQNVFMQPVAPVPIKVHKISIYDQSGRNKVKGYYCQDIVGSRFSLTLIGKGDRTGIITSASE